MTRMTRGPHGSTAGQTAGTGAALDSEHKFQEEEPFYMTASDSAALRDK